jgi:hypothetical protein
MSTNHDMFNVSHSMRTLDSFVRLKYMQAIALVTGDEFLLSYNLTIGTEDVLDYLKKLLIPWKQKNYIRQANFDDFYGVDFATTLGPTGFCYNFNMIDAQDLYNLDRSLFLFSI